MYKIFPTRHYKKSLKKIVFSGDFNKDALIEVIDLLSQGIELPQIYRDHQLKGDFSMYRECHIKSDLVLLYEIDQTHVAIVLVNIGSHSDLFG